MATDGDQGVDEDVDHESVRFEAHLDRVLAHLSRMEPLEVLSLGSIDARLDLFFNGIVSFKAILTGNRRIHYLTKHPEIAAFERFTILAAIKPEEIHVDRTRIDTFNHYVSIDDHHDVRVALRYSRSMDRQHSVITAMVTRKRDRKSSERKGNLVWRR